MADQRDQQQGGQTAQISGTVQIEPKDGADTHDDHGHRDDQPEEVQTPEKNSRRKFIVIAVVILLVIIGALFYWHSTYSEDTDDAQVDGNLFQVSSRVAGQVVKVYVNDNQKVDAGQVIAEIDPKDYQVALDQAEANLASAQAESTQASVNIPITTTSTATTVSTSSSDVQSALAGVSQAEKQVQVAAARLEEAKANATKSQLDVERYTPLVQKDVISKQQFDAAVASAAGNKATVLAQEAALIAQQDAVRQAQQKLAQARFNATEASRNGPQQIRVQQARAGSASAAVKEAQARVEQAHLNLSYCRITSPVTGIVNKKNVQVGANLSIGQDLLTVVPLTDLWVTANFKETQLQKMHPGQKVDLKVDALGGRHFSGVVSQIGGATGSKLSLFPPENATGNYVKVVQRIPVRIDFTDLQKENSDFALRPGFSVVPNVAVK